MAFVYAIRRVDEQQVANTGHRTAAHVVLRNLEIFHHVQRPDNVCFVFFLNLLIGNWTVVLTILKTFSVEANNVTATADIPKTITFDIRRTADTLMRPVVDSTG